MDNAISLKSPFSWARFFQSTCMIFGTTVGAGMLGIPLVTAQAGFSSALLVTCVVWLFMMITGLLLAEVTVHMPKGSNFISLSAALLGKQGKWITTVFFLFLYYALVVAYFSGGAPLLGTCLSGFGAFNFSLSPILELSLFLCLLGAILLAGSKVVHRVNSTLSIGMLLVFPMLILLGSSGVANDRLFCKQVAFSAGAVPILFGAFGFHNVIPSLTTYLDRDKRVLRYAIVAGTTLAFLLYAVWQWFVLGSLSLPMLEKVLEKGLPVTFALSQGASSKIFVLGQVFAFFALATSVIGVSFSLIDFIKDGLNQARRPISRSYVTFLVIIPPFICALLSPHLFDKALGVAGGFGEALMNGVLPVLLFIKVKSFKGVQLQNRLKLPLFILLLFSFWVVWIELLHLM